MSRNGKRRPSQKGGAPKSTGRVTPRVTPAVVTVNPRIPDDAPTAIKNALAVRNAATVAGRCSCGAVAVFNRAKTERAPAGLAVLDMPHEPDCPAVDPALYARWGQR